MYSDYFQTGPLPADQYLGSYDLRLVFLSFMVAIFASYIALDLTGRLRDRNNSLVASRMWLLGGAIAMGAGIWSMHFIGMLSFTIPGVTLQYDLGWTIISLVVAIVASGFALYLLKASMINVVHLVAGGIVLGFAIASMHYTGMAGMLISLDIRYLPAIFLLSIVIAIVASEAALWFALKSNSVVARYRSKIKFVSAIIMGIGICGMHYTGMAASVFTPLCKLGVNENAMDPTLLSMAIASITFVILAVAYFASSYKDAQNQQQYERARELGMAEIASSVLHNVGNVLNSANISVATLSEKVAASQLVGLERICDLLNQNKDNLGDFVTNDERGKHTLEYLNKLKEYWLDEKQSFNKELETLNKNLILIKETISTQQNLSKKNSIEVIVSLQELIDEAILFATLTSNKHITVKKHYEKVDNILADKVKLLQILVNLLNNAKDALMESAQTDKIIEIHLFVSQKSRVNIHIKDNGSGILQKNLDRIFNFGFTTKQSGHGFGLHTCALAVNEMGGSIYVKSDGENQGATFIIELPYNRAKSIS